MGHALHGCGAGPDNGDPLLRQFVHGPAPPIATGIVIIPAAGVERMAREPFNAFDAGQFGHMQRSRAHANELRGEAIATIGADGPARRDLVPIKLLNLRMEQGVVVEA